jgi:hypothetical protein
MKVITCARCCLEVTRPFDVDPLVKDELEFSWIDPRKLDAQACCPVPGGHAFQVRENDEQKEMRLWLNPVDVLARVTLDAELGHGCCGPGRRANSKCVCGALVGRRYGDCMGAHHFSPEPEATALIDHIDDELTRELARHERLVQANRARKRGV